MTEAKAVVEPDCVADDLTREAVTFVGIGRRSGEHGSFIEREGWNKSHSSQEEMLRWDEYGPITEIEPARL